MHFGTKVSGRLIPIDTTLSSTLTKPGEIFEVFMETEGIPDEQQAIAQALLLEEEFEDLKVVYVGVEGQNIVLQFTDMGPGQFSIFGVLAVIPTLFILASIIIIGYMLWQLQVTSPILILILGIGGLVLLMGFAGVWGKGIIPRPTGIRQTRYGLGLGGKSTKAETALSRLRTAEISTRKELEHVRRIIKNLPRGETPSAGLIQRKRKLEEDMAKIRKKLIG